MADEKGRPTAAPRDTFGTGDFAGLPAVTGNGGIEARHTETVVTLDGTMGARKVQAPRDMTRAIASIKAIATSMGQAGWYSIPFKDRQTNRTTRAEGPTVKLAQMVARQYGNCLVRCKADERVGFTMFNALFIDIETGFALERPLRQRHKMDVGQRGGDAAKQSDRDARAEDQIFGIGASKATRNVIVNALPDLCEIAFEAARSGILDRIGNNPDGARSYLREWYGQLGIPLERVERIVGSTIDKWTAPIMARLYTEVQSIRDKMVEADDFYPESGEPGAKIMGVDADGEVIREESAGDKGTVTLDASEVTRNKSKPEGEKPKKGGGAKRAAAKPPADLQQQQQEPPPEPGAKPGPAQNIAPEGPTPATAPSPTPTPPAATATKPAAAGGEPNLLFGDDQ